MLRVQDSSAVSPGSPTGWIPRDGPDRPSQRRRLLIGLLVVGALVVASVVAASFDQSGSSGPNFASIGFGTGGSECNLTNDGRSFPLGVPIRAVLTFSPALPTGGTVRFKIERNGAELVALRETITVEEPAPCIHGTLSPLEVGHYRVEYELTQTMMSPIRGEFDVVLADVAAPAPTIPATSLPPQLVALGEGVVIVDESGGELGTATVMEAKEPAPGEVEGWVAAPGYRLILAKVRYSASAPWEINMLDWALHDAVGRQYEPTGFGPAPVLVTRALTTGQAFEGWVGFEVPHATRLWIDMRAIDLTTVFSIELEQ